MTPNIIGVMRIRNEARWIVDVLESQLPWVSRIHILDDHSTDDTVALCRQFDNVSVYESPFDSLDESRDKQWILDRAIATVPRHQINGEGPWWVLSLDGDEVLEDGAPLLAAIESGESFCYSVRILYLWDSDEQIRVDGVYGSFYRPSLFRLISAAYRYQSTPFGNGANFHCSSIPQEYLGHAKPSEARVLHLGYRDREDRLRKYEWYTTIDPDNRAEDGYAHMVMGDLPEFPATEKRLHAGPLEVQPL